jgi:hypothetical protein
MRLLILIFCFSFGSVFAQFNPNGIEQAWVTNTTKKSIELDELLVVGTVEKTLSIDFPEFLDFSKADKAYLPNEPVLVVEIKGETKAYPLSILIYHQVINDEIKYIPFCVTFCTTTNSVLVYNRRYSHNDKEYMLKFGSSGMYRKGNMVLFDRNTETWWQQLTGEAIVGEMHGKTLERYPSVILPYKEYKTNYPNGIVLNPKTGFKHKYGETSLPNYENKIRPLYITDSVDLRINPMEKIVVTSFNENAKVYPLSKVLNEAVINDNQNDSAIVIFYKKGMLSVLDKEKLSEANDNGIVTVFSRKLNEQTLEFYQENGRFYDKQTNSEWNISGWCVEGELKNQQLKKVPYFTPFSFVWFGFNPKSIVLE